MHVNRDNYEPFPHPTVHGSYRVPVWVDPGEYQVCIAPKTYRYFNDQTVPDKIVGLLAMIRAIPEKPKHQPHPAWIQPSPPIPDYKNHPPLAYINNHDKRLDEIGWKVDDVLHMLVLDEGYLFSLHGFQNG